MLQDWGFKHLNCRYPEGDVYIDPITGEVVDVFMVSE